MQVEDGFSLVNEYTAAGDLAFCIIRHGKFKRIAEILCHLAKIGFRVIRRAKLMHRKGKRIIGIIKQVKMTEADREPFFIDLRTWLR